MTSAYARSRSGGPGAPSRAGKPSLRAIACTAAACPCGSDRVDLERRIRVDERLPGQHRPDRGDRLGRQVRQVRQGLLADLAAVPERAAQQVPLVARDRPILPHLMATGGFHVHRASPACHRGVLSHGRGRSLNYSSPLTGTQREFLQASERAAARGSRRRRQGAFAVLALLTVLAVVASGVAISQRAAVARQRDQAIYNQVTAEALQFGTSNTPLAAQLTLAAYHLQPTRDLASRLLNTQNTALSSPLATRAGSVNSVAFSRNGRTLAVACDNGAVQLWDVADPAHARPLGQAPISISAPVSSVAFSPAGQTLAAGNDDGMIQLWDVADC